MSRYFKRVLSLLLCALIVASVGASALAALEVTSAPEDADDGAGILDEAAITEKVNALIKQYTDSGFLNESKLSIAYTYTATGDSWYYNPDMWFYSASIYKVPLMMIMAEKESKGEVTQDTIIIDKPLSEVEKVVLVDSNNDYAHNTMKFITGETDKKAFEKGTRPLYMAYSSLPENYYHKDFVEYSYFTSRFMNDVMCTLYREPARFPHIAELLKAAMPDRYFHLKLGNTYDIAQKYGYYKDSRQTEWHNNTGIIYTPNPIVITVMTADAAKGEQFMGDVAELFVNYTLELDRKLAAYKAEQERAEQERIAAEQAAAEAEAKAKAEEEARIAKEEADRKAAQEAEVRAAEKAKKAEERKAVISKVLKYVGIAGGAVLAILLVIGIISKLRKTRDEEDEFEPAPRRGGRRSRYDDLDEDEEDFDEDIEDEDDADYSSSRKSSGKKLSGIFRSAAERREKDDEPEDEDDGELFIRRRPEGMSAADIRRKSDIPSPAKEEVRTTAQSSSSGTVPSRKAASYVEEEDEEFEAEPVPAPRREKISVVPVKKAPAAVVEEDEDFEEETVPAPRRSSASSKGAYKPKH